MEDIVPISNRDLMQYLVKNVHLYVSITRNEHEESVGHAYEVVERKGNTVLAYKLGDLISATAGRGCCGLTPENLPDGNYDFAILGKSDDGGNLHFIGELHYYDPKSGDITDILDWKPQGHEHEVRGAVSYNPFECDVELTFKGIPLFKKREEIFV